jgi:hypothetical protein
MEDDAIAARDSRSLHCFCEHRDYFRLLSGVESFTHGPYQGFVLRVAVKPGNSVWIYLFVAHLMPKCSSTMRIHTFDYLLSLLYIPADKKIKIINTGIPKAIGRTLFGLSCCLLAILSSATSLTIGVFWFLSTTVI